MSKRQNILIAIAILASPMAATNKHHTKAAKAPQAITAAA